MRLHRKWFSLKMTGIIKIGGEVEASTVNGDERKEKQLQALFCKYPKECLLLDKLI